jgi:quercetin dioxygenase-like cupin family protein
MKSRTWLLIVPFVCLAAGAALAQDATKADPTHYKVLLENASVRVLKINYAAGTKSKMHQHPDTIVVPLNVSTMKFDMADGTSEERELPNEIASYAPAATHNPSNVGKGRMEAILVEFKGAAPGTATLPTTRDGMGVKMLTEGPHASAARMTAEPTFHEAAGAKHDYDQIVIALGPAKMSLAVEGQKPKTTWARGDVAFIGRGVAHESKNTGGAKTDFIIVSVK